MEISREVKKELRGRIRECRKRVSREEKENWDALLCEQFITLLEEASFPVSFVYLYLDFRGEAGTRRILEALWAKNIPAALPRVEGEEIFFYEVRGWADVCPGYMGIEEPSAGCRPVNDKSALVLVPGVAFDREGRRLGYGGGYYDRFFAREPGHPRWGLAYAFQMVEKLPKEEWDQKVERVILPGKVIERIDLC